MIAEVGGVLGTLIYPHLLWPPSSALWGSSVLPYFPVVQLKTLKSTCNAYLCKMIGLPVLSVLTMENLYTKPPPHEFLNLYGACLQAPRTPKMKYDSSR
jgi:hypothetical protein